MSADAAPACRVSGPGELAAAVPFLVGHRPHESLVLVGLLPPGQRVAMTARVDLPPLGAAATLAARLVPALARSHASEAVLVVCTESSGRLPRRDVVAAVEHELAGAGIGLRDAMLVRGGRWWSYVCSDPACCPADGLPVPEPPLELAARAAAAGVAVLPDRAALERSVAPPARAAARQMRRAIRAARSAPARPSHESLAEVLVVAAETADGALPTADTLGRCVVALDDVAVRDALLQHAAQAGPDVLLPFLLHLASQVGPPDDGEVTVTLACVAYLAGHGGLANVALDRTLASHPLHRLAGYVGAMLDHGLPPDALRSALRGDDP